VNGCGRPIGGTACEAIFDLFAIVIGGVGLPDERGPVFEAGGVNDGAAAGRSLADGADIHAAALTNQKLGGA